MISTRKVYIHAPFLKFGKKEYMEKLIYEGEVFFNTVQFYRNYENTEIGDPNEGISALLHLPNGKLWYAGKCIGEARNRVLKKNENINNKNLFCLYGIENQNAINNTNEDNELIIKLSQFTNFGTHCVLINDIPSFTKRLLQKVFEKKLKLEHQLVYYYNPNSYNGPITPFMKDEKFSHQCEYRFLVHNTKNESIKFSIGNIEDIAHILLLNNELKIPIEIGKNGF